MRVRSVKEDSEGLSGRTGDLNPGIGSVQTSRFNRFLAWSGC